MAAAGTAIVSACKTPPPAEEVPLAPEPSGVIGPIAGPQGSARRSSAISPKAYREDGATHLYGLNADRIYKGKLPPRTVRRGGT